MLPTYSFAQVLLPAARPSPLCNLSSLHSLHGGSSLLTHSLSKSACKTPASLARQRPLVIHPASSRRPGFTSPPSPAWQMPAVFSEVQEVCYLLVS